MRSKHLLLFFAVLVAGGFTAVNDFSLNQQQNKGPENKFIDLETEKITKIEEGFFFDTTDLQGIRDDLMQAISSQTSSNFNWKFVGPNNVAGRIRAFLIDNQNPNVFYAAGVAGGVFKSETNGQYWEPVETNYNAGVLSVTSMVQTSDGTIYFTTGENFNTFNVTKQGVSSFPGGGVFKKAPDAEVFEQIPSTEPINNADFFGITDIAINPSDESNIFISTWQGVYKSTNGGTSWTKISSLPSTYATDIKVSENNVVITALEGKVYVNSGSGFENVAGHDDNMIDSGGARYEFAFAPSNPEIVYSIAANDEGRLMGVYRSAQGGANGTWEVIASGGGNAFTLFRNSFTYTNTVYEGIQAMMIAVDDNDPNYVYVGGMNLWGGYKVSDDIEPFQWNQKSYNTLPKYHPQYVAPYMHIMVAHPDNDYFYIGTDGGVFRYHDQDGSVRMNNYLLTGQFYDLNFGPKGSVLGGAKGNGVYFNDFKGPGSQMLFGTEFIKDEDFDAGVKNGFSTAISQISPQLMFYNHGISRLRRTLDGGKSLDDFYSSRLENQNAIFWDTWNNQFDLWETSNYQFGNDTNFFETFKTLPADTVLEISSQNIIGAPITFTLEDTINKGELVYFPDPYKSFFAIAFAGNIWATNIATTTETADSLDWKPPFVLDQYYDSINTFETKSEINDIVISEDGKNLYFVLYLEDSLKTSEIFRYDSLHYMTNNDFFGKQAGNIIPLDTLFEHLHKLGEIENTEVTSINLDPNNPGNLVLTATSYTYEDKVFLCTNANSTMSSDFATNFTSIQGNLPHIPIFDACINVSDQAPNQLMLGTEMGVWVTEDFTEASPSWTYDSEGIGSVPVMSIRQQSNGMSKFTNVENFGIIYLATYGKGTFIDSTYFEARSDQGGFVEPQAATSNDSEFNANIYPNPVKNSLNIKFDVFRDDSPMEMRIIDLTGRVLNTKHMGVYDKGKHTFTIGTENLEMGIYLFEITNGQKSEVIRLMKK